ncbi:DNA uptake porin HofQ [Dickeya lacustris]|uniref:DNA uptake porin HofQ n=1 Tax=Dickeya lacustris TaxID=2259638 RepID=A0ABY8G3Y6_9GAMM|nr:DNA uptake porin HofQ [Dickeya lacustris]WFN54637.1 DNA uptake porin HofQ [Dickeya lacustris]
MSTGCIARCLCGVLLLAALSVNARDGQPISLVFEDAPVQKVLQALADHQQLNLVVAPGVSGNLSLNLHQIPWQQALEIILQMGQLSLEQHGTVMMVYPDSHIKVRQQQQEEYAEKQRQQLPLQNRAFALQYAEASEVLSNLQSQKGTLLTARGSASVDKRTNTLLVRDTGDALVQVDAWITTLDKPVAQVQLAAHIVTISSEHLNALGVNWGMSEAASSAQQALQMHRFNVNLPVESPSINAGFHLARLSGRLLDLELTALEQENEVEIIASPRLFTAHQQTASIKQGTEIPYQVSSGASGSTSIEFKEAVLGMEVTPKILHNGQITLNLLISQNMPGRAIKQGEDGEALAIDKQEIQTQVTVQDGETIVLGGIFQQQKNQGARQVPGLATLPGIGYWFRSTSQQHTRRELVIFITPTLIASAKGAATAG